MLKAQLIVEILVFKAILDEIARADVIVTGDANMLAPHPFRDIAILTSAEYLERR